MQQIGRTHRGAAEWHSLPLLRWVLLQISGGLPGLPMAGMRAAPPMFPDGLSDARSESAEVPSNLNFTRCRSAKGEAEPVHFRKQFVQADGHTFPLWQCGNVNPSLRIARLRWAP